jgi:hypothetical protein
MKSREMAPSANSQNRYPPLWQHRCTEQEDSVWYLPLRDEHRLSAFENDAEENIWTEEG